MEHRNRQRTPRPTSGLMIAALVALAVSACGGGSGPANRLLAQTFAGSHRIQSGKLGVRLIVSPSGASNSAGAVAFSLAGPFQSLGPGRLPASAFTVSVAGMGTETAVTITSTGSTGYVTFQGRSYQLPEATFQRLESSFAQLAAAPGQRRGFHPERWLSNPQIVGKAAIQGVSTTHIRSGINVAALVADLNAFLQRASASGIAGAGALPRPIAGADRRRIAGEVKNPTVNVWTGVADKTLRRLEIDLSVPVSGQVSTLLGRSAAIAVTMQYADLNQPQRITAPTRLLPYRQFQAKLRVLVRSVGGGLLLGGGGTTSGG
jgi:hypothetical protein